MDATAGVARSGPALEPATLPISPAARRLSAAEKAQFATDGYVKNLPVFASGALPELQRRYHELAAKLPTGVDINKTNMWHKANRWVHDIARTPALLDYVEDLLGPDFYQWGGQFFVKYPGDGSIVPWHQDSQYWPLTPRRTVSVWLALFDTDLGNGAMRVVRGSHRGDDFQHHVNDNPHYALELEVADEDVSDDDIVTLDLRAGEISLHDDGLLHGSLANNSDRMRAGMTMRFCPPEVKADLSVWPTFEVMMARGEDPFGHNPVAKIPRNDGFPVRKFQPAADFD